MPQVQPQKLIALLRAHREWLWAICITSALVLALRGLGHPLGKVGLSMLWLTFTASVSLWKWQGNRHIQVPLTLMGSFALLHVLTGRSIEDLAGLAMIPICYSVYLMSARLGHKLSLILVIMSLMGSISLLIVRAFDQSTVSPGILTVYHVSTFLIISGWLLARGRLKVLALVLGIPAVIVAGSEEALIVIGLLAIVYLFRSSSWQKSAVAVVAAGCIIAVSLLFPVSASTSSISSDRFASTGSVTHGRVEIYKEVIFDKNWWYGKGWYFTDKGTSQAIVDGEENLWQTVHNVPLRIAVQTGIVSALAWCWMLLYFTWRSWHREACHKRSKYFWLFLIMLPVLMLDHFLWTTLMVWPFIVMGLYDSKPTRKSKIVPPHRCH